jgi:hypothetical protein
MAPLSDISVPDILALPDLLLTSTASNLKSYSVLVERIY